MNPLLQEFNTAPFNTIKEAHYKPAIEAAIKIAKEEINTIVNNTETPTFENTTVALDNSGEKIDRITSIFFNLNSAETNDEIQQIAQEISPWLSEFRNDITLNTALFLKVKTVFENKERFNLNTEQLMLLENQYKSFSRNGADLNDEDKTELRKIDAELSQLSLKFGENLLADGNSFELLLTDEADLAGLPESAKQAAKELANQKEKQGWLFTLDYPSYIPFMTYADNRALRKKLALAFGKKGFQQNEFNNEENVLNIVKLRHKRANLLGYKTHAHFVLEERMAETPEKVISFSNDLLAKAKPAAQKEFDEILKNDFRTVVWKENQSDWMMAEIVVSTVQSFVSRNKYKKIFKPDHFDLVISDEAHRSLGARSRKVFEYFIGFKLGLTATPKDYLKSVDLDNISLSDPKQYEKRLLLDTYTTFGCESGEPTYRYSLSRSKQI